MFQFGYCWCMFVVSTWDQRSDLTPWCLYLKPEKNLLIHLFVYKKIEQIMVSKEDKVTPNF